MIGEATFSEESRRVWSGQQDRNIEVTGDVCGYPVRLRIRVDSYDFQSYGRAEVFSPSGVCWNEVSSIPGQMLGCLKTAGPYKRDFSERAFDGDLKTLEDEVAAVLAKVASP